MEKHFNQIVVDAIKNLNPGAYISDLFRYCYLCLFGGIYFDCKKILFIPLSNYIKYGNSEDIYIRDMFKNYVFNAIMITNKGSKIMLNAIKETVFNIVYNRYCDDPLSISGPGLLKNVLDKYNNKYNFIYQNTCDGNHHSMSYIVINNDKNKRMIIQNTYNGYYQEGNYINTWHYGILWKNKKVYKSDLSKKYGNIKLDNIKLF